MVEVSGKRMQSLMHFLEDKREMQFDLGDNWGIDTDRDDHDTRGWNARYTYNRAFEDLRRPHNHLREYILAQFPDKQRVSLLDLFGSGKFATDWHVPLNILGLRTKDIRQVGERGVEGVDWQVHECNLYDCYPEDKREKLLREVQTYLDRWRVSGFDVIMCRPLGPFENNSLEYSEFRSSEYLEVYYQMFRFFYELLSCENGILFTMIPRLNGIDAIITSFLQSLVSFGCQIERGLADSYYEDQYDHVVRVVKTPSAVLRLPDRPACITLVD